MTRQNNRERFIQDVPAGTESVTARTPFKVETENRRRFIRLQISAPMSMDRLRTGGGPLRPDGDGYTIHGTILNISAGGVLVDLDQLVDEGDLVLMSFTLQEVEHLDNVLGLVKRVDHDTDGILAGIEFLTRERLQDLLSEAELELLGDRGTSFDEGVRAVLERYIVRRTPVME